MKRTWMFALTVGIVLGFVTATFSAGPSEAELTKEAKITKTEAERIALAKVSHGTVKSAEIEKEKDHLMWSFEWRRDVQLVSYRAEIPAAVCERKPTKTRVAHLRSGLQAPYKHAG